MDAIVKMDEGDDVVVITVGARLDLVRAAEFRNALRETLERTGHDVVLDLAQLEFIDSTGLGAIAAMWKQYTAHGRGFAMSNVRSEWIAAVLRMTRMDRLLPIHPDLEQAVAAARRCALHKSESLEA